MEDLSSGEEAARVTAAWKRIDKLLKAKAPRLLSSLNPGVGVKALEAAGLSGGRQPEPRSWFGAHDGQKPSATPFVDGYRLLPAREGAGRRKRHRGLSYRPDWDDSWFILAARSRTDLLCCFESVYQVDVSRSRYVKKRVSHSLWEWVEAIEASLAAGDAPSWEKPARRGGGAKTGRVRLPALSANLAEVIAGLEAFVVANPRAGIVLSEPATRADLRDAQKAFGRPLPPAVVELALKHDGQPEGSRYAGGGYGLLSLALAANTYDSMMGLRDQIADPQFWRPEWWPVAGDEAGDWIALDARSGAVVDASQDPYRRKRAAKTLAQWLARQLRTLEPDL